MKTNLEHFEDFGRLIDRIENLTFGLNMPLTNDTHVRVFKEAMPNIVEELKAIYECISGENPWKD